MVVVVVVVIVVMVMMIVRVVPMSVPTVMIVIHFFLPCRRSLQFWFTFHAADHLCFTCQLHRILTMFSPMYNQIKVPVLFHFVRRFFGRIIVTIKMRFVVIHPEFYFKCPRMVFSIVSFFPFP